MTEKKAYMKTYLELEIPLGRRSSILSTLADNFRGIPVRWQKGFWHLTVVFIDTTPDPLRCRAIISRYLDSFPPVTVSLDCLKVFTTSSGRGHVIALSSLAVPPEISSLAENLRQELSGIGCTIRSRFFFHVTLGRVDAEDIGIDEVESILEDIPFEGFKVAASKFNYRIFRGDVIGRWDIPGI